MASTVPFTKDGHRSPVEVSVLSVFAVVPLPFFLIGIPGASGLASYVFRATCILFAFFSFLALKCQGHSQLFVRTAMVWNSIAFWMVSACWCVGGVEWIIFSFLEHCFQIFAAGILVAGHGCKAHVLLTSLGAVFYLVQPSGPIDSWSVSARHLSESEGQLSEEDIVWIIITLVAGLVTFMGSVGYTAACRRLAQMMRPPTHAAVYPDVVPAVPAVRIGVLPSQDSQQQEAQPLEACSVPAELAITVAEGQDHPSDVPCDGEACDHPSSTTSRDEACNHPSGTTFGDEACNHPSGTPSGDEADDRRSFASSSGKADGRPPCLPSGGKATEPKAEVRLDTARYTSDLTGPSTSACSMPERQCSFQPEQSLSNTLWLNLWQGKIDGLDDASELAASSEQSCSRDDQSEGTMPLSPSEAQQMRSRCHVMDFDPAMLAHLSLHPESSSGEENGRTGEE